MACIGARQPRNNDRTNAPCRVPPEECCGLIGVPVFSRRLIGPDTLTEIPSSVLAQLCMWQLVVGYNLRSIEAREEMQKQLKGSE